MPTAPRAHPRKDEDSNYADVVEQHRRVQSFRSAAGRVLAREPARHAEGEQRHAATRLTVTPDSVPGDDPSRSSTTTEGITSNANPVAASSAPVTESSDLLLDPAVACISAPLTRNPGLRCGLLR